jgi:hypothetical protein
LISLLVVSPARAGAGQSIGTQTIISLRPAGSGTLVAGAGTANMDIASRRVLIPAEHDRGRTVGGGGSGSNPTTAPFVPGNTVTANNAGFRGFDGLNEFAQSSAGTGIYANSQGSLEPPDQGLCVGNGFVVDTVNAALAVRDQSGAIKAGPTPLNQFFNLEPVFLPDGSVGKDFTSDPKCYYDADTSRWFVTMLQIDFNKDISFGRHSALELAVSRSSDPGGAWNLFSIDVTNDGSNGITHPGCPCLGDQPLIGADQFGFYITTNEFPLFVDGFNGAQVYAMSKAVLAAGSLPQVVHIGNLPLAEGPAYSLQPATIPPDKQNQEDQQGEMQGEENGGTAFFLSALDFNSTLDNRIAVWALTNTSSLRSSNPRVRLDNTIVRTETYGQPPVAEQKPGPRPLAEFTPVIFGGTVPPLAPLNSNDARMNQVIFAHGNLWGAVNTVVKTADGSTRAGLAYFVIKPSVDDGEVGASLTRQGYIAVNGNNVIFPSIGVNRRGKGVVAFTLVGQDYFPTAAYAPIDFRSGAGDVHVAAAGKGPEDGFTGYKVWDPVDNGVHRWGDYSAAVAEDGAVWFATEYIGQTCPADSFFRRDFTCGGTRDPFANWGTFIGRVMP